MERSEHKVLGLPMSTTWILAEKLPEELTPVPTIIRGAENQSYENELLTNKDWKE